jgi:Na+/proline symporter
MAAHAIGTLSPTATKSAISIPFVVLAALLIGVGILALVYWLVTFDWLYFGGLIPSLTGALMLFHPRAGADRAD